MKITSVELHPHGYSEEAVLSFKDPTRANPYNVKAIVGLDADSIIPTYYGVGGNSYYNLSLEKRDVVIRVALNPRFHLGESYSSLRDFIYKLIASSRTGMIHIHFKNENQMVCALNGFITKVEAPQFNKEPELQLTVSCDDPMLRGVSPVSVDVSALDPALTNIVDNISTAPHGVTFALNVETPVASLVVSDPTEEGWTFEVTPSGGFLAGDVIYFSSDHTGKVLYLIRGDDTIYLADRIELDSVWPIMFPGDNPFEIVNPTSFSWNAISFYPAYWGV